jgi:hypothetical protein
MALHRRGGIYHYHFWVDGTRYRGSTKKANLAAARRVESLLLAQAEEKGDVVLRKRSPLLRDFKTRFFEWVKCNTTLKQKTKDYYENGWRLLEETDVAAMRLNAITKDDADRLAFPGGPSSHNNALRTLRRMLGKAEEWNIIKASPKIKLMQEHARERVIDADVEAKLLPFCKQPLRDVLMIMRDSGMRNQKEVFRMRWEHLDWGNKRYSSTRANRPRDEGLCQSVRGFDRHFWQDTRSKRKDGSFPPSAPGMGISQRFLSSSRKPERRPGCQTTSSSIARVMASELRCTGRPKTCLRS